MALIRTFPLALRLAGRELRAGLGGFRIFLACLALGVAAIAAAGSLAEAVRAGVAADARMLLGGDLEARLTYREASPEERAGLAARGTVSSVVEMRAMVRGTDSSGARTLVEVKGVDDAYPLYGAMVLEPAMALDDALALREGVWGAAVAPALLARLDLDVGERLVLGDTEVEVRAKILREPDASTGILTFGPRVMVASAMLPETDLVQPGSMIRYFYRLRVEDGTDPARVMAALEQEFPQAGWRLRGLDRAAPGLERFIGNLTLFLTLVGLTALLVGGIGVANGVRAFIDSRARTIAILKCLGAPGGLVFATYALQVGLLSGLGTAIGLVVGAATPALALALIGEALPVQARFGLYPVPLLVAGAFGLLIAVVFSLWPLARARDIPGAALMRTLISPPEGWPRRRYLVVLGLSAAALAALTVVSAEHRALAAWFVVGAVASMALFRLAGWVVMRAARRGAAHGTGRGTGRGPRLRLALGNLHRPGTPTPSVVLSLGLGLTVLVAIALIEGNLDRQIGEHLPEEAPAFFMIDIQPHQVDPLARTLSTLNGVRVAETADMLRGRITRINGTPAGQVEVADGVQWALRGDRGLTTAARAPENSRIVKGAWWPEDYDGPALISMDANIAEGFGVGIGDTITINILGREMEAEIANLRSIEWSSLSMNFTFIFSPGALDGAPRTYIATVHAAPEQEDAVVRAVGEAFPNVSLIRVRDALDNFREILDGAGVAVRATGAVTLLAGALVLAGAIAAGHRRRVYESVVLKVLGARRADLLRAYLIEYGLLGAATAAIALVIGSVAAWLVLTRVMRADWAFLPEIAIGTAVVCVLLTMAAGFAGTWRALGARPAGWLRNE